MLYLLTLLILYLTLESFSKKQTYQKVYKDSHCLLLILSITYLKQKEKAIPSGIA